MTKFAARYPIATLTRQRPIVATRLLTARKEWIQNFSAARSPLLSGGSAALRLRRRFRTSDRERLRGASRGASRKSFRHGRSHGGQGGRRQKNASADGDHRGNHFMFPSVPVCLIRDEAG